jgi:hypothetical protein
MAMPSNFPWPVVAIIRPILLEPQLRLDADLKPEAVPAFSTSRRLKRSAL